MPLRLNKRSQWLAALSSAALLTLTIAPAWGQAPSCDAPPPPACLQPTPYPFAPEGQPTVPGTQQPSGPTQMAEAEPSISAERTGAGSPEAFALGSNAAYIDSALPTNMFRLRYDNARFDNRPDRAEYFYAKCGCFRLPGGGDPKAAGPTNFRRFPNRAVGLETRVDYQDISGYLEVAASDRLSGFVYAPVRFLNGEQNPHTAGFADMNAGVKYAFLMNHDQVATFQLRSYIPTGDSFHGLGTNHFSLEPSLLLYQRLSDRLIFEAQVADWIPVDGSDFAGNVLSYGGALSYVAYDNGNLRIIPVAEMVGWSVLGGKEFDANTQRVSSASSDTIINAKFGVRFGFGRVSDQGLFSRSDLYVGYGRALTGAVWYKDLFRVEYRMQF